MKRPYGEGDWFAIPHGGGRYSPGRVVRGTRKLVRACIFRETFDHVPTIADLATYHAGDAVWSGVMSDRAIVHERWPTIGGQSSFDPKAWPQEFDERRIAVPIALETLVRTGTMPRLYRVVRDLGIEPDAQLLASYDDGTTLEWRRPLSAGALSLVDRWLADREDASLRFYGEALAQLPIAASFSGLRRLHIGVGETPVLPVFEQVRELSLERDVPLKTIARCFPNLRALRIAAANMPIDLRELAKVQDLAALDLSGVVVTDLDGFAALPNLRALRLHRTSGWSRIDAIANLPLEIFALEYQFQLIDIAPLGRMQSLEELTLRGLWQFNVDAMQWIFGLANLRRVAIDIGGRRRNIELYQRGSWAGALPFESALKAAADASAAPL